MKKVKILLYTLLFLLILTNPIYAHPGRTDGKGGHYNRTTGQYHYHHGRSEHQHTNGVCPYSKVNVLEKSVNKDNYSNEIKLISIGIILGIGGNFLYRKVRKK